MANQWGCGADKMQKAAAGATCHAHEWQQGDRHLPSVIFVSDSADNDMGQMIQEADSFFLLRQVSEKEMFSLSQCEPVIFQIDLHLCKTRSSRKMPQLQHALNFLMFSHLGEPIKTELFNSFFLVACSSQMLKKKKHESRKSCDAAK